MKIGLLNSGILDSNYQNESQVLGDFPDLKMYSTIQFGGLVEIAGQVYVMAYYDIEDDFLVVQDVMDFEMNPKTLKSEKFTCPHCKYVDDETWALIENEDEDKEEHEHDCCNCRSNLKYKRESLTLNSPDYMYIIESINVANYTRL